MASELRLDTLKTPDGSKSVDVANIPSHSATVKTTIDGADELSIFNSLTGFSVVKITLANFLIWLKGYMFGWGQTWQDVTGSRVAGTTYTNSSGKMIVVKIETQSTITDDAILSVNGAQICRFYNNSSSAKAYTLSAEVPDGSTYSLAVTNATIAFWKELR